MIFHGAFPMVSTCLTPLDISFCQVVVLDGALHLEHSLRRPGWDPMGHGWVGHGKTYGGAG